MLPSSLWHNNLLQIPPSLLTAYKKCLLDNNLIHLAQDDSRQNKGAIGGSNDEETDKHFAQRFGVSACRALCTLTSPQGSFDKISRLLKSVLVEGYVGIVDAPCGAGASTLSFLTTIYELRKASILPNLPLDLEILGLDISERALNHFQALHEPICAQLQSVGVSTHLTLKKWDVNNEQLTATVINEWSNGVADIEEYLFIHSAFSGELGKNQKFQSAQRSLQYFQLRFTDLPTTSVWIEPTSNSGEAFLKYIKKFIPALNTSPKTYEDILLEIEIEESDASHKWFDPIKSVGFPCRVQALIRQKEQNHE